MNYSFCLLLILFLFSSSSYSYEVDEDVVVLTTENFDSVVNAEDIILVEFYAPWCGHCKSLAPEYAKAAKALKGKMLLAKVDATIESELAERFAIQGFPTLKVFRKGVPSEYKGGRSESTIVSYLEKQLLPALSRLSDAEKVKEFSNSASVIVIGAFASPSGEAYESFNSVVNSLRDDVTFGEVIDANLASQSLGLSSSDLPAVIIFKKFDEGKVVYDGTSFDPSDLSKWIKSQSLMLLDEVSRENYKNYIDSGLPLGFIFYDPADAQAKADLTTEFTIVAKQYRGSVNFVFCDGVKYINQAKNLGLSGEFLPSLAVLGASQENHFAFVDGKLTSAAVSSWIAKLVDGTLEPTIKSEPEPEQTGPVYVLVGSSFERVAHDPTKDVLVEFYAPWCGHCKSLAPIYDEVGAHFKDVPSIIIAKMDATANDAKGVAIQGFPTLIFFPANGQPQVQYEGARDFDSLVNFVKKSAQIPINGGAPAAAKSHDHDDHDHHGHNHGSHDEL